MRLRAAAPGIEGIAGVPFLIFYGEVSEDSDGPLELCRPVAWDADTQTMATTPEIQLRVEPTHDEAYIRLTQREMKWPEVLAAYDALALWGKEHERSPAGAVRQLLIADQRSATPATFICDLSVPLK